MHAHSYHNYRVYTPSSKLFNNDILVKTLSIPHPSLFLSYFHVHVHVHVGLISRQEGDIQGSLELFRKAVILNPNSAACVKQVARSVYACINFVLYTVIYVEFNVVSIMYLIRTGICWGNTGLPWRHTLKPALSIQMTG